MVSSSQFAKALLLAFWLNEDGSAYAMERRRRASVWGRMGCGDEYAVAWEGAELERIGRSKRG